MNSQYQNVLEQNVLVTKPAKTQAWVTSARWYQNEMVASALGFLISFGFVGGCWAWVILNITAGRG